MADERPTVHFIIPAWGGVGIHATFAHRMPPLALLVLAALARRHGWRARVVDMNVDALPQELPDLVGITVWTSLAPQAYATADRYRQLGVPVVLGGVHASLLPSEALRHADAVLIGEAEGVIGQLLADAVAGGLQSVYTGRWADMADVPTADEWIDLLEDRRLRDYFPRNTIQTTRGCRFNCDYCSVIRINGRGSRHRSPDVVVEELRLLQTRGQRVGPIAWAALVDDDLAADLDYAHHLCEAIVAAKLRIMFSVQASIGIASASATLDLLRQAGCRAIFTGFESISRAALVETNKKNRPSHFAESIAAVHKRGILVEGGFIFGFDDDDPGVFERTASAAHAMGVDSAHFSLLTPLPGTQTFAKMASAGRIVSFDWGRYDLYHAVIEPMHMSSEDLERGLWRAYRIFYGGRPRFRRWLRHCRMQTHPAVGVGITAANWNYARRYRPSAAGNRPSYVAQDEDLALLLTTSQQPAERALASAAQSVSIDVRR